MANKLSRGALLKRRVLADLRARGLELSPLEAEILEEAARTADLLDRSDLEPREARQHRDLLRKLVALLDARGESRAEVRAKAIRAARARWSRVGGT
ncbi:MAG TPA: hypothetical protein VNO17_04110 [Actinomycetota bacterium]|nr:hypothetical protein [Actinomycetota bacterium]